MFLLRAYDLCYPQYEKYVRFRSKRLINPAWPLVEMREIISTDEGNVRNNNKSIHFL